MSEKQTQTDKAGIRKSIWRGTLVALLVAIVGGGLISIGDAASGLGWTMFLLLPTATGFVTARTVDYLPAVGISLAITLTLCLALASVRNVFVSSIPALSASA